MKNNNNSLSNIKQPDTHKSKAGNTPAHYLTPATRGLHEALQ